MSKEQKGFITYGDFEAVADELTDEQLGKIMRAKLKYFNSGKAPKFDGILKYVWIPIQQQMDRDSESYEKKCAKMRANANKRWSKSDNSESMQLHPNDANTKTNTDTDTKTDRDTDTMSVPDASSLSSDLISYLNDKAGTSHKPTRSVTKQIQGLLDSGYTPEQIKQVIDRKCSDWLSDAKMRAYLRPSTLFGSKFDEYLSAPVSLRVEAERKRTESIGELRKQLEEKQTALGDISQSIEELRDENGRLGENLGEYRILTEQKAILEDSIIQIEKRLEANAS